MTRITPIASSDRSGSTMPSKTTCPWGLTYSYDTQLRDLDSTSDSIDINRVVVELENSFSGP